MRNIFKSMETLDIVEYPLDILEHRIELRITNSNHAVNRETRNCVVDYDKLVHQGLKDSLFNELYGGLKPLIYRLADMAMTSKYANPEEIQDIIKQSQEIFKGE